MLEEEVGVDPNTFRYRPFSRRGHKPLWFIFLIVVPQGFEPRSHGPKPCVLPLDEGTLMKPICQRTFSFCLRFLSGSNWWLRVTKPGYYQTILRDQIFGYKKTRTFWVRVLYSFLCFLNFTYQLINENAIISDLSVRYTNDHWLLGIQMFICLLVVFILL
jgi:hypothetical protein